MENQVKNCNSFSVVKGTPGSIFGSYETWERKVLLCCVLMIACLFMNALCMTPCVTRPDFIWEEELHSHYHLSYMISRKITYDDLLDLHVRSLLCYLRVLGLMGLFALPHWTSYITMCFYFLKRCKFGTRLCHPKCTHIYISYIHVNIG